MQGILLRLIVTAIAVWVAAQLLDQRGFSVQGVEAVLLFSLVLGIFNALVKPVLLLLTLPLNLITLGLFTFVVNGFVFWLAAQFLLGVRVADFGAAFLAALIVTVVSFVLSKLIP